MGTFIPPAVSATGELIDGTWRITIYHKGTTRTLNIPDLSSESIASFLETNYGLRRHFVGIDYIDMRVRYD